MEFLKKLGKRLQEHDCTGLAAEMTYNWMLALIPTFIFTLTLFGLFGVKTGAFRELLGHLSRVVPQDALSLIQSSLAELSKDSTGGLAIVSFIGALWTASNGAITIEKAIGRAYGKDPTLQEFWRPRFIAFLIVIGLGILLMVCANLIIFGRLLIEAVITYIHPPDWTITLLTITRWAISILILLLISSFIYLTAPRLATSKLAQDQTPVLHLRKIWPGALTFVGLWLGVSWLFSLYVTNMGQYSKVYGPMGAIIVMMIWLYLTSLAMIAGGEVNALTHELRVNHEGHSIPISS